MLNSCGVAVYNQRLVQVKSSDLYHDQLFLGVMAGKTSQLSNKFALAFKQLMDSLFDHFISLNVGFMLTVHRPYNNNNYLY